MEGSDFPTQFAGVFRRASETKYMPTLQDAGATSFLQSAGQNGGLLRNRSKFDNPTNAGESANTSRFFVRDIRQTPITPRWKEWQPGPLTALTPLAAATDPRIHLDRNRNPFLRYPKRLCECRISRQEIHRYLLFE